MSLYDEVMNAGAPTALPPDALRRILAGESVDGFELGRGNYIGPAASESNDQTGDLRNFEQVIYRANPRTTGTTARWDTWNPDGSYRGYGSGPGSTIDNLVMMATGAVLGGAAAGWGSTPGVQPGAGATGMDFGAAYESGTLSELSGFEGATSYGIPDQAPDISRPLSPSETMPQVENLTEPITPDFQAPDASPVDPTNYSNEGRNYPNPQSTQGSGGSPVNSTSQFPPTPMTDVNGNPITPPGNGGNTVVPPVTPGNGGTQLPGISPSGINDFKSLFEILSGLYGLKLAGDAAEKSDPFGSQRPYYIQRLRDLEANPGLIQGRPGYFAGRDSVQRQLASKGYLGSGNQAGALMRYSGDFYTQEANRLAGLAGAPIAPGNTYFNQANLVGQSLSNVGYGLMPYTVGGPR